MCDCNYPIQHLKTLKYMSMDRALRPERLEITKVSDENSRIFLYWERCISNYIKTVTGADTEDKKLMILTNNISVENYGLVSDCTTYTDALKTLKSHYIKTSNPLFARHMLATRRQSTEESLDEYLTSLEELSRKCSFESVTADKHREECVLDAFVQGIRSANIRQKILESDKVELNQVVKLACLMETAQKNTEAFNVSGMGAVHAAAADRAQVTSSSDQCNFCGFSAHARSACPASNSVCHRCGYKGHWERMCRYRGDQSSRGSASRGSASRGFASRGFTADNRRKGSYYPRKGAAGMEPVEAMEYSNQAAAMYKVQSHDVSGRNDHDNFF